MSRVLLMSSESEDEVETSDLPVNDVYASRYDLFREKEELQRLKDKYDDKIENGVTSPLEDTSSSEDESDVQISPRVERQFFVALSSLRAKDPRIYQSDIKFFEDNEVYERKTKISTKPMFIGDMERKVIMENGGNFDEIVDTNLAAMVNTKSYNDEMEDLRNDFIDKVHNEDVEAEYDDLLVRKSDSSIVTTKRSDDSEYIEWLKGEKQHIYDTKVETELGELRDYWSKSDLDEDEKFLKDYILNKRYNQIDDEDDDGGKGVGGGNLSEDEAVLHEQEEFEHKYNFRFEEPDPEFIKRYPRTIHGSMRRKDDRRREKREKIKLRKMREKAFKAEEIKRLKSLKKKEICEKFRKLQKVIGQTNVQVNEDDLEGDFDPIKYDLRMSNIFKHYDDAAASLDVDEPKPVFSDSDLEEELGFEDWDNWERSVPVAADTSNEKFDERGALQKTLIEMSQSSKVKKRKSKLALCLERKKPLFDPATSSYNTFEKYLKEYYDLDCEDVIGDASNQLRCRFKYRKVLSNDFGLSVEEIMNAKDGELNAWSSLKKTCQYRSAKAEIEDINLYRNRSKKSDLKKKIMPSLYGEETEAEPSSLNETTTATKKASNKSKPNPNTDLAMSDVRLHAYGLQPAKFKRKIKRQKIVERQKFKQISH